MEFLLKHPEQTETFPDSSRIKQRERHKEREKDTKKERREQSERPDCYPFYSKFLQSG